MKSVQTLPTGSTRLCACAPDCRAIVRTANRGSIYAVGHNQRAHPNRPNHQDARNAVILRASVMLSHSDIAARFGLLNGNHVGAIVSKMRRRGEVPRGFFAQPDETLGVL